MARKYRSNQYKANISRATAGLGEALAAYKDFVKIQSQNQIFNDNARRIVKSYNQKLARARNRGLSYLPEKQSLRELRQQFPNRKDLANHLTQLEAFNKMGKSAFDVVETDGGGKLSRYQYYYIKANLDDTKEFYFKQLDEARKVFGNDPYSIAKRDYVLNLEAKLNYLYRDIDSLDQSGIKTFQKYISHSMNAEIMKSKNFRSFLGGVEDIMDMLGYDKKTINTLYDKLEELTAAEFIKLYQESDLINRIYELIPSPEHGRGKLNTDDENAKEIIDKLLSDVDGMVEEVKTRS